MALTAPTRLAVITRRGHARIGLAQSRDEADRWLEDAVRYRTAGATGRAIVSINASPASGRPAIGIRKGTPYERLRDWLAAPASPSDPRSPRREAVIAKLPAGSCARTLVALRTGLIVTLTGPATDGGRPLDRYLRVQAARSSASLSDIVLVMHVADRLSPWIAVSPPDFDVERF
ncbi:MAG: hypothetical protein OXG72_07855 [Acidobacteria bacterium]|nr:hypothetical protein [Acidobacteriota bacterium]